MQWSLQYQERCNLSTKEIDFLNLRRDNGWPQCHGRFHSIIYNRHAYINALSVWTVSICISRPWLIRNDWFTITRLSIHYWFTRNSRFSSGRVIWNVLEKYRTNAYIITSVTSHDWACLCIAHSLSGCRPS